MRQKYCATHENQAKKYVQSNTLPFYLQNYVCVCEGKQKYYIRLKSAKRKQISSKQPSKQQSSNIRFITRNKFAFIPYLYALKIVHTNLHAYYKYVIYVSCLRGS